MTFRWQVENDPGLYHRESFELRFGDALAPADLPEDVWWTVALLCLHNQWVVLRPCRVLLPVELPPGEREFWLRMTDAAAATLELTWGEGDLTRTVAIEDRGPRLSPARAPADRAHTALAFSGGKDSLAHLGLLLELGERPLAVTTTSPMRILSDHVSPRRRATLDAVAAHPEVTHVEVRSNFRDCWDNDFPRSLGYGVSTNELCDTMLYTAAAYAVAWAGGATEVLLASEAEVQASAVVNGHPVQHPHFMYSAATQRSLSALLERRGVGLGALTYPTHAWQVQGLLWSRYPELRELQYSCWRHVRGEGACSACHDCLSLALAALRNDVGPSRVEIDFGRLTDWMAGWRPRLQAAELPNAQVRRAAHSATVRELATLRTRAVASTLIRRDRRQVARRGGLGSLLGYARLRAEVAPAAASIPAPGYRHGWLALVEGKWRESLQRIFDSEFPRAPASAYADGLERARRLIAHNTEPLRAAG